MHSHIKRFTKYVPILFSSICEDIYCRWRFHIFLFNNITYPHKVSQINIFEPNNWNNEASFVRLTFLVYLYGECSIASMASSISWPMCSDTLTTFRILTYLSTYIGFAQLYNITMTIWILNHCGTVAHYFNRAHKFHYLRFCILLVISINFSSLMYICLFITLITGYIVLHL